MGWWMQAIVAHWTRKHSGEFPVCTRSPCPKALRKCIRKDAKAAARGVSAVQSMVVGTAERSRR